MANPVNKVRSPNYPNIDLEEAVKRTKVVYDNLRMHAAPRSAIASALGYKSLSGTAMSVVSALTKYGLLEGTGDQFKVSGDARDILIHHKGELPRAQAIQRAAFLPALFNELHEKYGDDPPSDHLITVYLTKKEFNANAIPGVIRVYRATLEFVKEESADSIEGFDDDEEADEPMQTQLARSPAQDTVARAPSIMATPSLDSSWTDQLQLRLGNGVTAFVAFRGEATPEAVDKLIKLLAVQYDLDMPKVAATPQREPSQQTLWAPTDKEGAQE